MQSMGQAAPLRVLAGHTYRDPVQVFNRCLMPVYQTSYRWTGNRLDAEDVTTWVFVNEFRRLDLPRPVPAGRHPPIRATARALGRPSTEGSGIPPARWSALHTRAATRPCAAALR